MMLMRFFTRQEPVAGLEISEESVRLMFIETDPKTEEMTVGALAEEIIPKGTVQNGIVKNKEILTSSLKKLLGKTGLNLKYLVVSIPADQIYHKMFSFPHTVSGERLEEAMELTLGFQLPFKIEETYLDWEKSAGLKRDKNEIFLAAVKKTVVDGFLHCLNNAGIKTVALEIHPQSAIRASISDSEPHLSTKNSPSGFSFFIFKDKTLRFLRTVPSTYINGKDLPSETRKIENFYETKNEPVKNSVPFESLRIDPRFLKSAEVKKDESKWLVAAGAALRAIIPRKEDDLISLMPIGTEKAYEYQRAASFSNFATNLTIGLSIFFAGSFLASLALMTTIQDNFSRQIGNLSSLPVSESIINNESRAEKWNVFVGKMGPLVNTMPRWSIFFGDLANIIPKDITISSLSLPSPEGKISLSGNAKDRTALNNFKKALQGWTTITSVEFIATNLEQKDNIPFSTSFTLSNPQALYNWNTAQKIE